MRRVFSGTSRDGAGNVVSSATVKLFEAGGTTAATFYSSATSTAGITSTTSGSDGSFSIYVDNFDYDAEQTFKITIEKAGYSTKTTDNVRFDDVVLGTYTISADRTVTTNLVVPKGVIYSIATGKTLTISGPFDAGDYQVFSCVGTGKVAGLSAVKAEWFGAKGDGTTDDSSALSNALAAGSVLIPTPGKTYIATAVSRTGDVVIRGDGATSTYKHKASSSGDMFDIVGNFEASGVKFDGNRANQTGRYTILDIHGSNVEVRDCQFTGSVNAAMSVQVTSGGYLKVLNNTFGDMAEHGGTAGQDTQAINATSTGAVQLWFKDNVVTHGTPSDEDAAPGGFIVSGTAMSIEASGNYFKNIGQMKATNYVGAIDLYTDCDKTIVTNNRIDSFYYVPLKLQNSGQVICANNIINGEGHSTAEEAINLQYARTFGSSLNDWIVSGNILNLSGTVIGIKLIGNATNVTDRVIVSDNIIYNTTYGIDLDYETRTVTLSNNIIKEFTTVGVRVKNTAVSTATTIKSVGNLYDGGTDTSWTGFYARDSVTNLRAIFNGDTFSGTTSQYAISVRTADTLYVDGCDFDALSATTKIDKVSITNERLTSNNHGIGGTGEILLSTTTLALNADGDTTIYTVPTGYRCVLTKAVLVAGANANSTDLSIGQDGAETDWLPTNQLDNLDAQYDAVILMPVPNTTPTKTKSYAAGTVIEAKVSNQAGGATNTLYLFGILY